MNYLWTKPNAQRGNVSKPTFHSASRAMTAGNEAETNTLPLSKPDIVPTDPKIAAVMHPDTWTTASSIQYGDRLRAGRYASVFHGYINGYECVVKAVRPPISSIS